MTDETWSEPDLERAHEHSIRNREELARSRVCACFHCRATFPTDAVDEWCDDRVEDGPVGRRESQPVTALCPRCGVDAVLGDASGFPVADQAFLWAMHQHWF